MFFPIKGGIYEEPLGKWQKKNIVALPCPEYVLIPVCRRADDSYSLSVSVGSRVERGAIIAEYKSGAFTVPVYASICGKVKEIRPVSLADGNTVPAVRIEYDPNGTERISPMPELKDRASAAELLLRSAACADDHPLYSEIGLLGERKPHLIVNCFDAAYGAAAESQIYAEGCGRLSSVLTRFAKAVEAADTVIAADRRFRTDANVRAVGKDGIRTVFGRNKYPMTPERLVRALFFKDVPLGTAAERGFLIIKPSELSALDRALSNGVPKTETVVSIAGDAARTPGNYLVPAGTTLRSLIKLLGRDGTAVSKAVFGGALSGRAVWDPETPVLNCTDAVWFFGDRAAASYDRDFRCIRCGRCAEVCPEGLIPAAAAKYVKSGNYSEVMKLGLGSCIGCGCCAYVCPGRVPLLQHINTAKGRLKPHDG